MIWALLHRERWRTCIILISLLMIIGSRVNAQTKHVATDEQFWIGYFNQTRLTDKWGLWFDTHFRTQHNFFDKLFQVAGRVGITYYLNDEARLTAGYTYFNHFIAGNHEMISQPEHRLWQQIQWQNSYPKLKLVHRIRMEERWRRKILDGDSLVAGYNFNYRARYQILSQFPLSKKRFQPNTLSFVIAEEVMINFGKEIVDNYFDANRLFLGFAYHVTKQDNIQLGYMNVFQQLPAGNFYRSNHVIRLYYFHNLDLRRQSGLPVK